MKNFSFQDALVERFLRYVAVDTQSHEDVEEYPSSKGQFTLGKILADELAALGLKNIEQDKYGYVFGTIPASKGCENAPVVALLAHMDTSPEKSGKDVKAIIHKNYDGSVIDLPNGEERSSQRQTSGQ